MSETASLAGKFAQSGLARAFRHRDFARYAVATWVSNVGMWVMRVGIGWLMWHLTESGAWLGAASAAQALPSIFLTPFAGALADRMDQVKIMQVTQLISGILAAGIAALIFAGHVTPMMVLGYAFLHGTSFAMGMPARVTIGPNLVPREDISAAIATSSIIFGTSMFMGPAISGLLIDKAGIGWTFAVNSCAYFTMYGALYGIKLMRTEHHKGPRGSLLDETMAGVKFVANHRGILSIMVLAFTMSLLIRPLVDLMPGFADVVYGRPTEGLATLMSSFGIGAMAGSVWMANRNKLEGTVTIALTGVLASGLLNILFASISLYPLAIAAMFALGITSAMGFNSAQILVQNAAAGPMRARVMGLYAYNFQGVPALGAMVMGTASRYFGLRDPVIVGGCFCLLTALWIYRRRERVRGDMEINREATAVGE